MKLLLDAHTLVWVLSDPNRLPAAARAAIANKRNELFVSIASVWELANKIAAKRLLGIGVESVIAEIEGMGAVFLEITQADVVTAAMLPRHHLDPFDRMIVAQAQARSLVLVTKDAEIAMYEVQILWQ